MPMTEQRFDGQTFKQALKSAEVFLEKRIDELNALNVFPVPDGDTGINMYLTLQSATTAVENLATSSVAEISAKAARGALLGARGNSGVILSQILRGMAKAMEMKERFSSFDLAQAMHNASELAYQSIAQPVEGTIITVIREASEAAMREAERGADLKKTMTAIVTQSRNTVKKTPELLPKLKEAGVVDAGGKGLFYIFLGMKNFFSSRVSERQELSSEGPRTQPTAPQNGYGVEIQFLVEGDNLPLEEMRDKINRMGESVLVVGDEHLIRVHVHTQNPEAISDYCASKGCLKDIAIEHMDEQVKAFQQTRARLPKKTGK